MIDIEADGRCFHRIRDGLLPAFLGRVHPRTRTPLNAVTVYFVLTLVLILAVVSVVSSLGFVFIVTLQLPVVGLIYVILSLLVGVYYLLRVGWLKKSGVDWEEQVKMIPKADSH